MHDIRAIREEPEAFAYAMGLRGIDAPIADILAVDAQVRELTGEKQACEQKRNQAAREAGKARAADDMDRFESLRAEATNFRLKAAEADGQIKPLRARLESLLAEMPNTTDPRVPKGADQAGNVELRRIGIPPELDDPVRDHVTLGTGLRTPSGQPQMDFADTARISGARFVTLRGDLARMERALGQFMLDMHTTQHGYTEISPPLLVSSEAVHATGQLPKFADDLFRIDTGSYAIPTAEVPLTNMARERIFADGDLPLRMTAATPCFRAEAGAAGRDTRGMIRLHQFFKVELVSICSPEQSEQELERMTSCAEAVLQALELPYRVVALCTGDIGFSARRTYDIEVWMPSAETYREVSSCSNCGDFQARRMAARLRSGDGKRGHSPSFVHTLNGSALAVGRTLAAVIENRQNKDGSIDLPSALRPLMGGMDRLS